MWAETAAPSQTGPARKIAEEQMSNKTSLSWTRQSHTISSQQQWDAVTLLASCLLSNSRSSTNTPVQIVTHPFTFAFRQWRRRAFPVSRSLEVWKSEAKIFKCLSYTGRQLEDQISIHTQHAAAPEAESFRAICCALLASPTAPLKDTDATVLCRRMWFCFRAGPAPCWCCW